MSNPKGSALVAPASEEGRSLTLYELTGVYAEIANLLNENLDEEFAGEALTQALETTKGEILIKAENLAKVIKQKEAEVEWITEQAAKFKNEFDRLMGRAGTRERGIQRLKDFIVSVLGEIGEDTQGIKGSVLNITLAKRGDDVLEVMDASEVDPEFIVATLKMPLSQVPRDLRDAISNQAVNKQEINKAFKEQGIIPKGTAVVPKKRNLKIY